MKQATDDGIDGQLYTICTWHGTSWWNSSCYGGVRADISPDIDRAMLVGKWVSCISTSYQ